jgi:hypothetical protein
MSILPSNYDSLSEPASNSNYFKPSSIPPGGAAVLRLCGTASSGHAIAGYQYFTNEGRPRRFETFPERYMDDVGPSYEGKNMGTGEKGKPSVFLSWACYPKDGSGFKVLDISQVKIREKIVRILGMDDYTIEDGEMANFCIEISREGTKLDTKYDVLPILKKPTDEHIQLWRAARNQIWLPALFSGGDPFAGRPAGSGKAPDTSMMMTSRDELGADTEVVSSSGW